MSDLGRTCVAQYINGRSVFDSPPAGVVLSSAATVSIATVGAVVGATMMLGVAVWWWRQRRWQAYTRKDSSIKPLGDFEVRGQQSKATGRASECRE